MKLVQVLLASAIGAALIIFFNACEKEAFQEVSMPEYEFTQEELDYINENFCSTPEEYAGADDRGTGQKGKFWPSGKVLRVRFMNGSASLKAKVFAHAATWAKHANVSFSEVTGAGYADIRVRFGSEGNNSMVGTDNQSVPLNKQTMNLQLTDNSSEEQIRRATLHEFGHALGLKHEHQNPLANIPWNKPKVYAYYQKTQGWDKNKVDQNVLNNLGWGPAQHTDFDKLSIMAYSIPDSLTTNGFSIPWNTQLSARDKEFIGKMYASHKIRIRHAANISGTVTFNLNGVYTTLAKNETHFVPAYASGNNLQLWECPSGCFWSVFYPSYGKAYKIVSQTGQPNDLKLVEDK